MKTILTIVLILLAYINYRHLNIGFLSFYSIDEYAFHGSLLTMYEGLTTLNIRTLFSFGFYSYGFGFFFLNLLATAPFFATDNIEMTIYIPRIITSLFAFGSLWFIYKIALNFVDKYSSIFISLIVLSMPGFYKNALWFHPDWMMSFFVIVSIYLFIKDDFNYKKYFWWAIFSLGVAISVKIQAITFLPFVFLYIFYDNFRDKNFDKLYFNIKIALKSFVALVTIFVITNPYLIHPTGLKAFVSMFIANMKSNATNHGLNIQVTIEDKIFNVIDFYYLNSILFIIVLMLALYFVVSILNKQNKKTILPMISLYFIANIIYLFFMVNKDWQHYYLTIFTIIPILFVWFALRFDKQKYWIFGVVLLLQVSTHISQYKEVLIKGFHPTKEINNDIQQKMSTVLIKDLKPYINKNTQIVISSYQPFDFRSIGLSFKNINGIYGPISKNMFNLDAFIEQSNSKDPSKFKEKDFIILSKTDIYFDKEKMDKRVDKKGFENALKIIENFNNSGDLGYEPFKENEYFYIWRKK